MNNGPYLPGHYPLSTIRYPLNCGTCHVVETALKIELDEENDGGGGEDGEKSNNRLVRPAPHFLVWISGLIH